MHVVIIAIKAEKWNSTYTFSIVYTHFQKHLCHICVNNVYNRYTYCCII